MTALEYAKLLGIDKNYIYQSKPTFPIKKEVKNDSDFQDYLDEEIKKFDKKRN